MDDKRVQKIRKLIGTLANPRVSVFIDPKKFYNSGVYSAAVQMAMDHAVKHGDFNYLNQLFVLLDGTRYADDLISTARSKLIFVITDTKPRRFKMATPRAAAKAAQQAASAKSPGKKALKNKAKIDLMDSGLMLSGSYGSGKRR